MKIITDIGNTSPNESILGRIDPNRKQMTRKELIELGKRIVEADCSEEEHQELYDLFNKNVPHPDGASLFYWPENYNARRDDISQYDPSVEEVVEKALSYKAIEL